MAFKIEHLAGFVLGVGVTAISFVFYLKKGRQIVGRSSGNEEPSTVADYESRSLEELIDEKERLEDRIAEREMATHGGD